MDAKRIDDTQKELYNNRRKMMKKTK